MNRIFVVVLLMSASTAHAQLAFPGAEGHGASSQGGRGGAIIPVTTLADSGPGSLRSCIEAKGPRVCVFRVSGVIRFTNTRPIIVQPRLTIAGETAPGGGILVTHAGGKNGLTPIVIKNTTDVVIRHVRVRTDRLSENRASNSAFTIENSRRVILDHVSGSWAMDQNLTGQGDNDFITVSSSIFAQGLPRHDKCALIASDPTKPQRYSFIRNICAHNGDRNPDVNLPPQSCVEVTNNIFYNPRSQFSEVWESYGGTPISFVGNIFRRGPDTVQGIAAIDRMTTDSKGKASIHAEVNLLDKGMSLFGPGGAKVRAPAPACKPASRILPAEEAWTELLGNSGALPRDSFDQGIIQDVMNRQGRIVEGPGALPTIAAGTAYPDQDKDGMDDQWELANGAHPNIADAWGDADGDGWANLENFLDWRHRQLVQASRGSVPQAKVLKTFAGLRLQN